MASSTMASSTVYYIASSSSDTEISKEKVDDWLKIRAEPDMSLDELIKCESSIWSISLNQIDDWRKGTCSCPYHQKNNKCKHLCALSSVMKIEDSIIPETAKQIGLGQKRKRGAPGKAKKALIIQ